MGWCHAVCRAGGCRGDVLMGASTHVPSVYPSTAHAAAGYFAASTSGGRRIASRRAPGSSRQELVCVAEFGSWLNELPPSWGRSLGTAVPEDIISYMDGHWVHRHGRTLAGDSSTPTSSFSGAKGCLLHLEHYFDLIGRSGEWQPFSGLGNPCRSVYVRLWRCGYERHLWGEGVRPHAALPALRSDIDALVPALLATDEVPTVDADLESSDERRAAVAHAIRQRNAALVLYNHASSQRGGEGARLRWTDLSPSPLEWTVDRSLVEGGGRPVLPLTIVSPNGHKTAQRRKCGSFTIDPTDPSPSAGAGRRFLGLLSGLLAAYSAAGYDPSPYEFIFPQCAPGHRGLLGRKPLTAAGLRQILKRVRDTRGGEAVPRFTAHSFRRGRMIQDARDGVDPLVTRSRALGITSATYSLYTDETRPCIASKADGS